MNDKNGKVNTILIVLVSLLVVVVAIQSFFLFKPYTWINEFLHRQSPELKSPAASNITLAPMDQKIPFATDKWLNKPFDPEKWNPFEEMEQMQQKMDLMFDSAFGRFSMSPNFRNMTQEGAFAPSLDLKEDENRYVVRIDLPGVKKADIDIHVEGTTLIVKGKREEVVEQSGKDGQTRISERRMGEFERSIVLPQAVDADHMETTYENGTLTIILPKAKS